MSKPIIKVNGLSKVYRLGEIGISSLREEIERNVRRWRGQKVEEDKGEFRALRDISFEVEAGEVLGVIGKNGAGKSTLLKLLSRITEPTNGEIRLRGRVAALLEVGTGFHPELTGRENIYLNGTILGMKKREIDAQLDEIIAFSGIEKHIDTPVKRYSSGMNVRLGFAVAAHLQPEILIVDEVLAVGDAEFQKKCIGKMQDVAGEGRTVLFVSHNMASVRKLCGRALLLQSGKIAYSGDTHAVIDRYLAANSSSSPQDVLDLTTLTKPASLVHFESLIVRNHDLNQSTVIDASKGGAIELQFILNQVSDVYRIVLSITTLNNDIVYATTNHSIEKPVQPGRFKATVAIPRNLLNEQTYKIKLAAGIPNRLVILEEADVATFNCTNVITLNTEWTARGWPGVVAPFIDWKHAPVQSGQTGNSHD